MALTVESLKGLYEKLGGTDFGDVTTIPEAIDKVTEVAEAGGGYTYETVFETPIPQMDYDDGWYAVSGASSEEIDINPGDDLAFLSSEYPLTFLESEEDASLWGLNITADYQKTGEPAYGFLIGIDKTSYQFYSSVDLSNTTLEILKKVSGGGSITVDDELSETSENPVQNKVITAALQTIGNDYKVTLTATHDEQTQQVVLTADNKSVAEIFAAAVTGKHCYAVVEIGDGVYQRYELYHYSSAQVTFYGVEMDEEGGAFIAKPVVIEGAATGGGNDEWTVID